MLRQKLIYSIRCLIVSKITMPNGRFLFTVSGSTASYTVYPDVLAEGYCPCPSFSQAVINTGTNIIVGSDFLILKHFYLLSFMNKCKHLLAVKIALQIDGCIEKSQGLTWIAGLATNFAAAPQT